MILLNRDDDTIFNMEATPLFGPLINYDLLITRLI